MGKCPRKRKKNSATPKAVRMSEIPRREFLKKTAQILAALGLARPLSLFSETSPPGSIPARPLGKTGHQATIFALGGEGVLRTNGRMNEAVPVIQKALDLGVNYFDTAPAYSQSQDYYGEALGERRKQVFLATKTHERSRDGSLALLDNSLKRLRTDHLDLWQLHDLRSRRDLAEIFGKGGALKAVEEAKKQKLVRFAGITGHEDPHILLEAMERYPFDTVMIPVNAADRHYLSFIDLLIPKAVEKNMGIIAMKVLARGAILKKGAVETPRQAISYTLSQKVTVALIGCSTPQEVAENAETARNFQPLPAEELQRMEMLTQSYARQASGFKAWR
jgi:aryl-alcohol dehydrogenase-like predicted oxidoreductase